MVADDGGGVPKDTDGVPDFRYVATHICDSWVRDKIETLCPRCKQPNGAWRGRPLRRRAARAADRAGVHSHDG